MRILKKIAIGSCLAACLVTSAAGQLDDDNNGLGDMWELAFGVTAGPDEDSDGDGFSNREEAQAGTDPYSAADFPKVDEVRRLAGQNLSLRWKAVAGIKYQAFVSADLNAWVPAGEAVIGKGHQTEFVIDLATAFPTGGVARSKWSGLTSGNLSTLKSYVSAGTPIPQLQDKITELRVPQSVPGEENFGQWIRGWIVPPASGAFRFWIASDDSSELWVSTDASSANKVNVASVSGWTGANEWTKYPTQQSWEIQLVQNQAYYFEIYHREYSSGDHLAVAWTRPGMAEGTRELIGAPHLASGGVSLAELAAGGRLFVKLQPGHVDSDGDGIMDYEEHLLGLDPANPASTPRVADLVAARKTLASPSVVTLGVSAARAYEAEGVPAKFTVFRSGGMGPLTVPYQVAGTALAGIDYTALPGSVKIPAGVRSVEIWVEPIAADIVEPQETVVLALQAGSSYELGSPFQASVMIDDAADVLFIAQLRNDDGSSGGGQGTAVVRRSGNSLVGRVSLSFSGLPDAQSAAELYISETGADGPVVFQFPLNQVPGLDWNFDAVGALAREEILAALDGGRLWARVLTGTPGTTAILGRLVATPAWETMPTPPEPPAAPALASGAGEASRFLTQATFGPRTSDVQALTGNSYAGWIDAQLGLPATPHLPYVQARRAEWMARPGGSDGWQGPRNEAWWQHALTAPDQLRQRMAFALSQIFVISQFGALDIHHEGTTHYYDMLLDNGFGSYRELLEKVTLSPMMGTYLSMMRNRKPNPVTGHEPDENYAREVMQLFSVGLNRMHSDGSLQLDAEGMPIPTYTQDDTVGLAHVFTGWGAHYNDADPPRWSNNSVASRNDWFLYGYDAMRPMTFYPDYHDQLERKILDGATVAAGSNGITRMDLALDAIANHPNVGPFMARQLIQKFVTSNPSPGYVHRIAGVFNDDGSGTRGNLGATLKAVLLDYEARHPDPRLSLSYGKPSEPLLRMARMLRVIAPTPPRSGDGRFFLNFQYDMPEQAPLLSSSVFNFYQPGYSNPGAVARAGLASPEFQIFSETTAIRQANRHHGTLGWGIWTPEKDAADDNLVVRLDFAPLVAILNTPGITPVQAQALLIDHLDERLLFGAMSPSLRGDIVDALASLPSWFGYTAERQAQRVQMVAYLIFSSPEYFVQR